MSNRSNDLYDGVMGAGCALIVFGFICGLAVGAIFL